MQRIRYYGYGLLALGAALCLGCAGEDEGPPTYPVTGTVTFKGAPVEGVAVSFFPDAGGQSAIGVTDASGKYTLKTGVKDGAVPGAYKVTVAKFEGEATATTDPSQMHADYDISNEYPADYDESKAGQAEPSKNVLPAKYADPTQSGLTATVKEGENIFDFPLEG